MTRRTFLALLVAAAAPKPSAPALPPTARTTVVLPPYIFLGMSGAALGWF